MNNFCDVTVFPSDLFCWDGQNRFFISEISELSCFAPDEVFRPLYNDVEDVGFAIESSKTHCTARFYLSEVCGNNDGDIMLWVLKPTSDSIRKFAKLSNVEVHILND